MRSPFLLITEFCPFGISARNRMISFLYRLLPILIINHARALINPYETERKRIPVKTDNASWEKVIGYSSQVFVDDQGGRADVDENDRDAGQPEGEFFFRSSLRPRMAFYCS